MVDVGHRAAEYSLLAHQCQKFHQASSSVDADEAQETTAVTVTIITTLI